MAGTRFNHYKNVRMTLELQKKKKKKKKKIKKKKKKKKTKTEDSNQKAMQNSKTVYNLVKHAEMEIELDIAKLKCKTEFHR